MSRTLPDMNKIMLDSFVNQRRIKYKLETQTYEQIKSRKDGKKHEVSQQADETNSEVIASQRHRCK